MQGLPADSALGRAEAGHSWTSAQDWNIADIRDAIATLTVMFHNVNRADGSPSIPQPDPAWRPGDGAVSAAEVAEKSEREAHDRLSGMLLKGG